MTEHETEWWRRDFDAEYLDWKQSGQTKPRVLYGLYSWSQTQALLMNAVPFALDVDILEAIFNAVNKLRELGGRTKAKRAEIKIKQLRDHVFHVDCFRSLYVDLYTITASSHPRPRPEDHGRVVLTLRMFTALHGWMDWGCSIFTDTRELYTGLSSWRAHKDGEPLIDPAARVKWRACRARLLAWARACVVFSAILEEIQLRPGGTTYRRVRARFETFAAAERV